MSDHHYYEYHQHRDHFIISLLAIAVAIIVIIITMILASFSWLLLSTWLQFIIIITETRNYNDCNGNHIKTYLILVLKISMPELFKTPTIMVIIFSDFLMVYWIFFLQQIFFDNSNKHGIYQLPRKLKTT